MALAKGPHCSFVLLAEFDIDSGAQLTYQFPQPLGTDEGWAYPHPRLMTATDSPPTVFSPT